MKKPDNIVYDYEIDEYDAYKKSYPTSFNSKNFGIQKIKDLKSESMPYFHQKFQEIKQNYEVLLRKLEWNQTIFNSKCNFNPIIGQKYHLYINKNNNNFLSIINPEEWKMKHLGTFILKTNNTWEKVEL